MTTAQMISFLKEKEPLFNRLETENMPPSFVTKIYNLYLAKYGN